MHEFESTKLVPLDDAIAQTCWSDSQGEASIMLSRAISSLLKPLKAVAEKGSEVEMKDGEIQN